MGTALPGGFGRRLHASQTLPDSPRRRKFTATAAFPDFQARRNRSDTPESLFVTSLVHK